ncbi:MAG: hypothetical protein J6A33_07950 [Alphaproteobacteria bacterium]|nr:hypothetical protein [Alphaproteobacteria bacterium]
MYNYFIKITSMKNNNLPNSDLIALMMKRLNVCPSILTLNWLEDNVLSLVDIVQNANFAKTSVSCVTAPIVSQQNDGVVTDSAEISVSDHAFSQKDTEKQAPAVDVSTGKNDFFEGSWDEADASFELTPETILSTRCGMFAYLQGNKVFIRKSPLSREAKQKQHFVFAGILLDQRDNLLWLLNICEQHCGYGRALKKLPSSCRFPYYEECEVIFCYKDILQAAFLKLHINLKKIKDFFYQSKDASKLTASIFNLENAITREVPEKSASSASFSIRVISIN